MLRRSARAGLPGGCDPVATLSSPTRAATGRIRSSKCPRAITTCRTTRTIPKNKPSSRPSIASTSRHSAYLLRQAQGDPRRRRHAARPLHDRLRQRQLRRQSPQPRRSADPVRGQGRELDPHRPAYPLSHNTPLNNLWLSMLDRMGSSVDALGDSTGRLPNLT